MSNKNIRYQFVKNYCCKMHIRCTRQVRRNEVRITRTMNTDEKSAEIGKQHV
jgi:hypothetical protein